MQTLTLEPRQCQTDESIDFHYKICIIYNMVKKVKISCGSFDLLLHTNGVKTPKKIILCLQGFNGDLWGDGFSVLKDMADDILVCSFDSAGHGESQVKSLDMRLNLINQEIVNVVKYLSATYENLPIIIYAISYGAYRAMTTLAKYELPNVKHIVLMNPAFKMLDILQKLKEFDYKSLKAGDIVPMKASLNKYLRKDFLDDIYENNVYKFKYDTKPPMTIFVGLQDGLIPRQDILSFADVYPFEIKYIDDDHCPKTPESWQTIKEFLKSL